MNTTDLIAKLANDLGVSKAKAHLLLDAVLDNIEAGLKSDRSVVLTRFGTFVLRDARAREGRNPQTGEAVHIPKHTRVAFRASPVLRRRIP